MQSLFNLPEEYDSMLKKGIGITGNDKHYFISGRLDWLKNELSARDVPNRILDFGCGIGDTAFQLAHCFPDSEIAAWDISDEAVNYAKKRFSTSRIDFLKTENLETTSGFDLVYINCVLHHIAPKEREPVFQKLFQLAKAGGLICCFENNPANPGTQLAMFKNPFDKGVVKIWPTKLQSGLEKVGFKELKTRFLFYFPQWMSWFRPIEKHLSKIPMGGQYVVLAEKLVDLPQ